MADLVAKWDYGSATSGAMNVDEFVKIAAANLSDTTLKKLRADLKKGSAEEEKIVAEQLQTAGVSDAELRELFVAHQVDGAPTIEVKTTLEALIAADKSRKAKDAALLQSCGECT